LVFSVGKVLLVYHRGGRHGFQHEEARGEYFVSFAEQAKDAPPARDLSLGQLLGLGKERAVVSSLSRGTAISFEGELPFVMDTAYEAVFADLSTPSGMAATLDYSDESPLLFKGQWCTFDELKLRGLRVGDEEGQGPRLAAANLHSLKCASCGAPHELRAGGISQTLVCSYCDAVMDLNQDATFHKVLQFNQQMAKVPAKVPLGSKGTLPGQTAEFTCIGYMSRSCRVEGVQYKWCEYLLYEPTRGYQWLTESNNHWTVLRGIHSVPSNASGTPVGRPPSGDITWGNATYKHFQRTVAKVDYVAGEFFWRVRQGESSEVNDYVAPPHILSCDVATGEINWSAGTYLTGKQVWQAFKLPGSPPAPLGVANNQPNPHKVASGARWRAYFLAVAACFCFLMLKAMTPAPVVYEKDFAYREYQLDRVQVETLTVPPGRHNLTLSVRCPSINQRWAFFLLSLIDEKTQEVHDTGVTLYEQNGSDDEGRWSDSVREASAHLAGVQGGQYLLRIEPQSNVSNNDNPEGPGVQISFPREVFRYYVRIDRDQPQWGYFWMLLMLGLLPPLWSLWRSSSFETGRWSESDHAPVSSSDDE